MANGSGRPQTASFTSASLESLLIDGEEFLLAGVIAKMMIIKYDDFIALAKGLFHSSPRLDLIVKILSSKQMLKKSCWRSFFNSDGGTFKRPVGPVQLGYDIYDVIDAYDDVTTCLNLTSVWSMLFVVFVAWSPKDSSQKCLVSRPSRVV